MFRKNIENKKKHKIITETTRRKKLLVRKRRRRGRAGRRAKRREAESEREKVQARAHHRYPQRAYDGGGREHRVGRAAEVLGVYQERGCDIIVLQETWRSGQSALVEAGYMVYCSGEGSGEGGGKKGQGRVGLAIRRDIIRAQQHCPEVISDRLLKVTLELCGRARAVTFVVAYAPTDTQTA